MIDFKILVLSLVSEQSHLLRAVQDNSHLFSATQPKDMKALHIVLMRHKVDR